MHQLMGLPDLLPDLRSVSNITAAYKSRAGTALDDDSR